MNSLSIAGQVAYPVYPRDLVFGLLPFAMLAFIRAADGGRRWLGWAALAGVLLGICGLIQVQLLLPIPFALATYAVVVAWRAGALAGAFGALVTAGLVAAALVMPWLVFIARRSPATAASRSSRPRTCSRSASASGTTRSSSG